MEETHKQFILNKLWQATDFIICSFVIYISIPIIYLHLIVPFFPVLLLFDFCFFVGHPLFVKYVLKKKWDECIKKPDTNLKYILLPSLALELIVIIIYWQEFVLFADIIVKNR